MRWYVEEKFAISATKGPQPEFRLSGAIAGDVGAGYDVRSIKCVVLFFLSIALATYCDARKPWSRQGASLTMAHSDHFFSDDSFGWVVYHLSADGHFKSEMTLSLAGQSITKHVEITPDASGRWAKAVCDDRTFERSGNEVRLTEKNGTGSGTIPEDTLIYAKDAPALVSLALRHYNAAKGGAQMAATLTLNDSDKGPLTLTRLDSVERVVADRQLRLTRWKFALTTSELQVLADEEGRVYVVQGVQGGMNIPEQHIAYVREGFEELILSPGINEIRRETIRVPMRDGVKLATDLYSPAGIAKTPVILLRTPYSKAMEEPLARF